MRASGAGTLGTRRGRALAREVATASGVARPGRRSDGAGGDFNLHTDVEPDQSQFLRLLAETGLQDVCATLSCPEPGRIDKFLFRSNAAVTITPLSWHFETDVFVRDGNVPLSDHEALAVRFGWAVAGS